MDRITQTKLELVKSTPLFSGLTDGFVRAAVSEAEQRSFAAGEAVFTEGCPLHGLGILISGSANVYKRAGGAKVLMSVLGPGSMTGAACLFIKDSLTVTEVRAVKACSLIVFSESVLRELMQREFGLAENYMRYLSGRVRFLTDRIESIGSPNASEKLMNYIALNASAGKMTLPVGCKALADALCMSRASLYRVLDALESEGRLRREGKTIYITDNTQKEDK